MQNILEEIYRKMYEQKTVIEDRTKTPWEITEVKSYTYSTCGDMSKTTIIGLDGEEIFPKYKDDHKGEKVLKRKSPTTLVIPDAHVLPTKDIDRFIALGKLIKRRRPDNIVIMGDFVTLESLSAWDLGKTGKMEGKRYNEDCTAGKRALAAIALAIQTADLESPYKPNFVYIMGNHEYRLDRYLETRPELDAHLDLVKDLGLSGYGITEVVPYRGFVELEGVLFTHAVMNAANQPVGGKTALGMIAQTVSKSVVIGHLHRFETVNHYRHGAEDIIQIVSSGCFFEGVEDYADGGLNAYWRGVLLLTHWKEGRFDIEQISTKRLLEMC